MKNIKKILITMLLALSLTACNLPGLGADASNNDVVVASGIMSERQVLAEITLQMINHHNPEIKTDLINNLGDTRLILQTLIIKDANIAGTMYTGTSLTGELGQEPITDPDEALRRVIEGYYEEYDSIWMPTFGFENTYAFMIRRDFAEENGLEKVSDLEEMSDDLKAGVDSTWMRREGDGYEAFKEVYGFDFDQVLPMKIGLVYDAVASNQMDIVLGYSTDGRIQANDLVLLEDDLNLFPPYDGSPIVTMDLLQEHPELEEVFLRLEGSVPSEEMQELNRQSDEDKIEPRVIAKEYLEEHNYFEDAEITPLKEREEYKDIMKELDARRQAEKEGA